MKTFIGIDNGVSGSIAIISQDEVKLFPTPVKKHRKYTQEEKFLNRIIVRDFAKILVQNVHDDNLQDIITVIERPMVDPKRFNASISAIRAFEATLIVLEELDFPYMTVDSKTWQKRFLPADAKGVMKKTASKSIGIERFPSLEKEIKKQKDADALFIALWAKECL